MIQLVDGFNYIIIGNSAAGVSALEAIRQLDKEGSTAIISEEDYPIYSRCLISHYLAGEIEEEKLFFRPTNFYKKMKAKPILGTRVVRVIPSQTKVVLAGGKYLSYDKLLLAIGASPKRPEIEGQHHKGVFVIRTIEDVKKIISLSSIGKRALIIGGGLVGIKAAYGLNKRGLKVSVVVSSNQILSQMVDLDAATILTSKLESHGITVQTGLSVKEIRGQDEYISVAVLSDENTIPCQLVIIAKGVNPNVGLLQGSGIKLNRGILTDGMMRTNIENIFAAGDVVEAVDLLTGDRTINALWPNAISQGRVAGLNMAGGKTKYDGSISMNSINFYDLNLISFGIVNPRGREYETLVEHNPANYRKLVIKDEKIVGMITVGNVRNSGVLLSLATRGERISNIKDILMGHGILKANKILTMAERNRAFQPS